MVFGRCILVRDLDVICGTSRRYERSCRWSDALVHYKHAALLDGSENHLTGQARILWLLGRSDEAVPIAEDQ